MSEGNITAKADPTVIKTANIASATGISTDAYRLAKVLSFGRRSVPKVTGSEAIALSDR
jgi:hypothetical protein